MKQVPFYANTPDNTHCYQASIRMVLKYFLPENEYAWEELEKMTAKVEGLWTWPTQGIINLHKMGFDVVNMEDFSLGKFIKDGGDYLIRRYGEEVGQAAIENSVISQEQEIAKEYKSLGIVKEELPDIADIKQFIDDGYLVICNVNSKALKNKKGYIGHFVVVYGYDDTHLILNNPGLPPAKNQKVSNEQFMKAWAYPDEHSKNLLAFRLITKMN